MHISVLRFQIENAVDCEEAEESSLHTDKSFS